MRKQLLLAGIATAVLVLGTSAAASAADLIVPVDTFHALTCTNLDLGGFLDIDRRLGARVDIIAWFRTF